MKLLSSARKLKEREETPEPFEDPYSDMTPDEKSKMIIALMAARERDAERIQRDEARIDELLSKVDELLSLQRSAIAAEKQLDDYKQMTSNLLSKIAALEERLKVRNKNLYAGKSQKGIHIKKREVEEDHTRDKDDFDGTLQSLASSLPQPGEAHTREENVEAKSKEARLYREMYRLSGESMHLSRMSLTNWLEKGSTYFCGLIAYLMNTFWTQLFAYLNDGSYSTDNSIAERFIRPLAGERKNSLFFGSDKMARVSAVYHTLISTCRMQGVSVLDYFKRFFSEIVKGGRDYEHLLPLTIGLEQ